MLFFYPFYVLLVPFLILSIDGLGLFFEFPFLSPSITPEYAFSIEIRLSINGMRIGLFPLPYDLSHISIGHFLVNNWILQGIGSMLSKEEIDDYPHENVEYQHIGVGILEDHQGRSQEHPDNDHERNHRYDFLYHTHVRTALLIFVEHCQSVAVEVELCVEVHKPKEMDKRV